jgi:16S rRNA (guanine1516-N2)-methyltransferase
MQPLFRACGVGSGCLTVLDCTAGLLGDALLLAERGMLVTACERNASVAARQRDLLEAWLVDPEKSEAAARLTLVERDARDVLQEMIERAAAGGDGGARPDVVYVDPMHPERRKSALVKKDMRDLRDLVGGDEDAGDLLALGMLAAQRRVVVKWPRVGPGLETRLPAWWVERFGKKPVKPSGSVLGRATRWDVFTPRR